MKKLIVTGVLLIGLATGLKAQYVLREADTEFNRFHYKKAAVLYERAYKKKATRYAAGRLGDCYRLNLDDVEAEAWYAIASKGEAAKPDMVLQYADVLRRNAKYPEAKQQYERYAGNADVKSRILSCDTAQAWVTQPSAHQVSNVKELNTSASDWAPVIYDGQVVLASDRGVGDELAARKGLLRFGRDRRPDTREDGWTGNNYMHLLYQNTAGKVKEFPLEADTRYHVGPASFSLDDKMFFSRTYVSTRLTGRMTTIRLEIFSSKKDAAGRWGKPQAFAYNKPDLYSVGDPFITSDGKTLYFSSDMPGGKGGMDIYKCVRREDGSWSAPEAVNAVNTPGNERTPAMASGVFYFSSDGYIGLGGLDIMRLSPGAAVPQNMGVPVNSSRDDFACALWPWGEIAYLSSNRPGGAGKDDVYAVEYPELPPPPPPICPVPPTPPPPLKKVTAKLTGFEKHTLAVGASIPLQHIYFDYAKASVRNDARPELDKLVSFMETHPEIYIELGTHTDSRGNDAYNLKLSQQRAESVVAYLVKKGIAAERMTAKGYGETQLLNRCTNGVVCTDKEHQQNRRTEFKIVKM